MNREPARAQAEEHTWTERVEIAGGERVKELIAEGNVRRLIILLEVPLTAGAVVGGVVTLAAPVLAAMAALLARVKVVRTETKGRRQWCAGYVPASRHEGSGRHEGARDL